MHLRHKEKRYNSDFKLDTAFQKTEIGAECRIL